MSAGLMRQRLNAGVCRLSGNSEAWEMVDREAVKGYLDQGFTVIFFVFLLSVQK